MGVNECMGAQTKEYSSNTDEKNCEEKDIAPFDSTNGSTLAMDTNIEAVKTLEIPNGNDDDIVSSKTKRKGGKTLFKKKPCFILCVVFVAKLALAISIYAQRSLSFVKLSTFLITSETLKPVDSIGLFEIKICANNTQIDEEIRVQCSLKNNTFDCDDSHTDYIDHDSLQCRVLKLQRNNTNDFRWMLSRIFSSASIYVGIMSIVSLLLSVYYNGVFLRSVGIYFLITYMLQISTFMMFDSKICIRHGCQMSRGSISGIIAGILWLGSGIMILRLTGGKATKKKKKRKKKRKIQDDQI